MSSLKIKTIVFNDDSEITYDADTSMRYTLQQPFVEILYKGVLRELINIQSIRSMDVFPPEPVPDPPTPTPPSTPAPVSYPAPALSPPALSHLSPVSESVPAASHPRPKRCKWCQQLTESTPCHNCGK